MKRDKDKKGAKTSYIFTRETIGMTLMLFSVILLLMLLTFRGVFAGIGAAICTFMYGTFGYGSLLVTALCAYLGEYLVFGKKIKISVKKAVTLSLTAFMLFLVFHSATTHGYSYDSFGGYVSACYTNAQNGFSGYTFGGVISAMLVYPVAKLGGMVTAYIVFSVLALLCGYLTFLAFKGTNALPAKTVSAEPAAQPEVYQPESTAEPVQAVQPVYYAEPVPEAHEKQQVVLKPQAQEHETREDKYSRQNLGRKILFEKGEFAAESYRRNMIFNENSYFNHPVTSEADYLSSFSSPNKPKPAAQPKSYSESYQELIDKQPVTATPSSYVYGDKPVEKLVAEEPVESVNYESYGQPENGRTEEPLTDIYGYDEPEDYNSVQPEEVFEQPVEAVPEIEEPPAVPPVRERIAGFREESVQPPVQPVENDKADDDLDRIFGDNARTELGAVDRTSNAELLDDIDEDETPVRGDLPTGRREESEPVDFGRRSEPLQPVKPLQPIRSVQPEERVRRVEQPVQQVQPEQSQPEVKEEKPKHVWKKYVRPSLDLLDNHPENANVNTSEIEDNKRIIVETLERFKMASEVANVTIGPAITRYDVIIEDKTKVNQSLKYRDAIAMELKKDNVTAYLNYTKGALSIEVPNNRRAIVGIKSMLASPQFINGKSGSLTFALGKNVDGEVVCPDITKMPHLLVAGTTGSGKSICLSALLVSLLYKYGPEELRLILVDPKQVEFISYDGLPHLMINEIIYDCDKAIKALNWAIKEMERRYSLFKDMTAAGTATKNLDEYNAHLNPDEEKLPKIVIVLDEFGDLMLQAKKDIESRIIKLVQKARACGIHLILATQRPSVDCITGLIKSNLPTRIGFKVNSFDDSRTIFDIGGAEKLLGKGDSYFRSATDPDLARIQCCFVDTHEVQKVTDFIKANNETYFDDSVSDFINTVEQEEAPVSIGGGADLGEDGESKIDDTFIKALKYCVTSNQASVSMIQRRFPIGYIKACKIIDWMENMNYITPSEGSKPRKVLLSKDEFTSIYGDVDD